MADALKFMIEFIDKVTRPASVASAAVSRLEANLAKLRGTVADVAALPALKFPAPKLAGGAGPKAKDAFATGAMDQGGAKMAKEAARIIAASKREELRVAREVERAKATEARLQERVRVQAARESQKQLAQVAKANALQAKAAERSQIKAAKDAARAQKALGGTGRSMASIAKADRAHEFVEQFANSLGLLVNPATLAAAALTVLAAGVGALLLGGAKLALAASEAKNDTLDMLEAMLGSKEAALRTNQALEDVTRDTAVSQQAVRSMAQELTAAGVTNEAMLLDAVKAIAQTESVLKGAGAKIQNIVEKAAATGKFTLSTKQLVGTGVQLSALYQELAARTGKGVAEIEKELKDGKISAEVGIAALTKVLDKKFGAVAAKQALDLGAQLQRARDNFSRLFEDVDTGPFLEALSKVLSVLDASTPAGKALKETLTAVFDGLFRAAEKVLPFVRIGLKGLILIGLKVYNALRPLGDAISEAFGGDKMTDPQDFGDAMIRVANAIGEVTAQFVRLITQKGVWSTIVFLVDLAVASFEFLWDTVTGVVGAFIAVEGAIAEAMTWLADIGLAALDAGSDIIGGLLEGLTNGAGELVAGVKSVANQALAAFKNTFGIHSDSKEMMKLGRHLTGGLATGIDNGAKAANDNMGNVVSIESARARAEQAAPVAAPGAQSSRSTSLQVTFAEGSIQINGSNMSVEELRTLFPEVMVDAFERMLLSQGGGEKVA